MAFSALLALFPFIVFLVSLSGIVGQTDQVQDFIAYAFEYLPVEVGRALYPVVSAIVLQPPQDGVLIISLLGTLWVSSSGVEAVRTALDRAYGVPSRRPFWWRRLQGLAFVVAGAMAILVVMITIVIGPLIWHAVNYLFEIPDDVYRLYNTIRYATGALWSVPGHLPALSLPAQRAPEMVQRTAGRAVRPHSLADRATLYSLYLGNIGNYSVTYGSLGGVIGAMLFFVSAIVFIFGAELNSSIMHTRSESSS